MLTHSNRRLAALAMVLLLPALGACGFGYQTDQVYQPGVGVNDRSGDVNVLGAVVVSDSEGSGTFVASLVNTDDAKPAKLTTITGEDGVEVQLVKPVEVEPDSLLNLAPTGAVSLTGDAIAAGAWARLTLEFDSGQKTEVNAPVVDKAEEFSDVSLAGPGGSPSGSPSPSPSGSPSGSPSPAPSGSPSPAPSGSPTP